MLTVIKGYKLEAVQRVSSTTNLIYLVHSLCRVTTMEFTSEPPTAASELDVPCAQAGRVCSGGGLLEIRAPSPTAVFMCGQQSLRFSQGLDLGVGV